ncbi:probable sodium/potassium/calcium exchanger CG1090 isoform X2 [Ornithodoros turicata]
MNIDPDVAGATLMAAASSVPAIAASIIAILVAKGDLGISTTLGSAVLNAAGVISVSALFAGKVVLLHKWPMYRDSVFFLASVVIMLVAMYDEVVTWSEATALLVAYAVYAVFMAFDAKIESFFMRFKFLRDEVQDPSWIFPPPAVIQADNSEPVPMAVLPVPFDGLCNKAFTSDDNCGAEIRASTASLPHIRRFSEMHRRRISLISMRRTSCISEQIPRSALKSSNLVLSAQELAALEQLISEAKQRSMSTLTPPKGTWLKLAWILVLPISVIFHFTIPDCKTKRWRKWFLLTFVISTIYISIFSYILVWMITIIGFTLNISDTVMGLTFLSIGVTLPDVIASLLVVRKGFGDMAVCNALGSNIFEILVGLGLPWLIKTAIMVPGSVAIVESKGLVYSTGCLLSTVFFLVLVTHLNKWKMNKLYGTILMLWYFAFMAVASLYELNVFGNFNPPSCDSDF